MVEGKNAMIDVTSERVFPNRRIRPRFQYREPFTIYIKDQVFRATAINISLSGISGELRCLGTLPERISGDIYLQNFKPIAGRVSWSHGREMGITFAEDLANHPQIRALIARMENGEEAVPRLSA